MSVIIRLQNLPWAANAMDIRNYFRGLSIPEGGVHIVGGEQGDAFIAFSTDEDARQAMMNDGGKIKEIQVKLLLSSRSEMHKVIEAARQTSIVQLAHPAMVTQPMMATPNPPIAITNMLQQNNKSMNMPPSLPIANMMEMPKPMEFVIDVDQEKDKRSRDFKPTDRKRTRSKSRDREKKERGRGKKDTRDRSRSRDRSRDRERRRRDRSRSRERRDRKRDRKDRSRDRERSKEMSDPRSGSRKDDKKNDFSGNNMNMPINVPVMSQDSFPKLKEGLLGDHPPPGMNQGDPRRQFPPAGPMQVANPGFMNSPMMRPQWSQDMQNMNPRMQMMNQQIMNRPQLNQPMINPPVMGQQLMNQQGMNNMNVDPRAKNGDSNIPQNRFQPNHNNMDQMNRLQQLDERRNPDAFQTRDGSMNSGGRNMGPRPTFNNDSNNMNYNNNRRMPPKVYNDRNNSSSRFDDSRDRGSSNTRGCSIQIKNLLPRTGYGDVRRFFAGHFITSQGLKFINDDMGKRTGVAYVRFSQPESKRVALLKHRQSLKGEPVMISHLEEEEFDRAIDDYKPDSRDGGESGEDVESQKSLIIVENDDPGDAPYKVLFLEEMPSFAKEHDVIKMFSDYSLLSIVLDSSKAVRKQYIAYAEFVNADDAKAAFNNKSKHLIGHKLIKVSPCTEAAFERAKLKVNQSDNLVEDRVDDEIENHDNTENSMPVNAPMAEPRDPRQRRFESRNDDVNPFNQNRGPFPNAVGNNNSPFRFQQWRGTNQNQFPNQMPMGNNMERMPNPNRMNNDFERGKRFPDQPKMDCAFLKGLPLRTSDRDILDFFSDVGVIPSKIHLMLTVGGQPSGDCFCEFMEPHEAATAVTKNGTMIDMNVITVELVANSVVQEALGIVSPNSNNGPPMRGNFRGSRGGFVPRGGRGMRGMGRGSFNHRGGHRFSGGSGDQNYGEQAPPPENFGTPGCVLSMENVPFRAGVDEILQFFSGYNLTQPDIIRRFNDNGHATGDARVSFRTPSDAQRAQKQLHLNTIRDRPISLNVL